MAYTTKAGILKQLSEAELIQLTDDAGAGSVDDDIVDESIDDADDEIDGYLGGRYTVPLSAPVPGMISKISVDIAIYNLYARRADSIPEIRKERYENAIAFLKKVAEGRISLGSDDPSSGLDDVAYESADRVFTSTKLDRF